MTEHLVRRLTPAPQGLVLGNKSTGEVVNVGPCVQVGDIRSVPFTMACGRCRNCNSPVVSG